MTAVAKYREGGGGGGRVISLTPVFGKPDNTPFSTHICKLDKGILIFNSGLKVTTNVYDTIESNKIFNQA